MEDTTQHGASHRLHVSFGDYVDRWEIVWQAADKVVDVHKDRNSLTDNADNPGRDTEDDLQADDQDLAIVGR